MQTQKTNNIYDEVISNQNIFAAIYALESFLFEKNLLSEEDMIRYTKLTDKYNEKIILETINLCEQRLINILKSDDLFEIKVYFKAKKYDENTNKVECRPMHTADLITQICLVSMLNVIMFKINHSKEKEFSDLCQLLPSNFYGNMPCLKEENLFYSWKTKYKEYTETVIKTYDSSKETGEYKYEVCLDLKKYFPSVDPAIVFNYILSKISVNYNMYEIEQIKVILSKLLFFKICNLDENSKNIYYLDALSAEEIKKTEIFYNLGLPQGLPQAYFFGNICMIEVSKCFNQMFPGTSFFYVDDSMIYTNSNTASKDNFKSSIIKLNEKIKKVLEPYSNIVQLLKINKDLGLIQKYKYKIEAHEDGKSTSLEIENNSKMTRSYLMPMSLEVSRVSYEVNSTLNDIHDTSLMQKMKAILEAINKEIESYRCILKNKEIENTNNQDQSNYLKILKRYKKFFLYRLKIMDMRLNETEIQYNQFFKKYSIEKKILDNNDKLKIFDLFDEDIFLAEAQIINTNIFDVSKATQFRNQIAEFEQRLVENVSKEQLYFSKNLNGFIFLRHEYDSLDIKVSNTLRSFKKVSSDVQIAELKNYLNQTNLENNNYDISNSALFLGYGQSYDSRIFKNSNTYKRKIMNSVISRIFNVQLNNDIEIMKTDRRSLRYYELRILTYIRNSNVCVKDAINFILKILNSYTVNGYEKIDFSIYEVLNIFISYVKSPEKIDQLILMHKYVAGIWKNGSKFLYFYTLHNHEHSVELINASISICKSIDYLQIKDVDYFILFLSCYLHDISMVLHPDLNSFSTDDLRSDEIYADWKLEFNSLMNNINEGLIDEKKVTKQLLKTYFEKISNYFESNIRDKHPQDSARFIRENNDLNFIDKTVLSYVGNISEAHGYLSNDVYGLKSKGKTELISEKYLMIILRLADLMDMNKDRISLNILNRNIKYMPEISKFHWISHSVIEKCEIKSEYSFDMNNCYGRTFLCKNCLIEIITIELYVNYSSLVKVKSLECKNVKASISDDSKSLLIDIASEANNEQCDSNCSYICKWMCIKNDYLLKELISFKKYLERNGNNIFSTQIRIKLNLESTGPLSNEYLDVISKKIV